VFTRTRIVIGIVVAGIIATVLLVAGCSGTPQMDDLKGINPQYPNYAALYVNVDGHPNVMMLCIQGVGIMTTTREYGSAAQLVPQWNAFCETQIGKKATQLAGQNGT